MEVESVLSRCMGWVRQGAEGWAKSRAHVVISNLKCWVPGMRLGRQVMNASCRVMSAVPRKWVLCEDSGRHCESEAGVRHRCALERTLLPTAPWNTD